MFESKLYEELLQTDNEWETTDLLCLSYSANPRYVDEVVRCSGIMNSPKDNLDELEKHVLFVFQEDRAVGAWDDPHDDLIAQYLLCSGNILTFPHQYDGSPSFHPKLILQVHSRGEEQKLRLVISSKNLTREKLLEGAICLEGVANPTTFVENSQLIKLFEEIKNRGKIGGSEDLSAENAHTVLNKMIKLCRQTKLAVGDASNAEVLVGGLDNNRLEDRLQADLQATTDCVIVSPFLSTEFFTKCFETCAVTPLVVGNRSDYTKDFQSALHTLMQPFHVLKENHSADTKSTDNMDDDDLEHLSGFRLHAKIYALDQGNRSVLYIGSPNFSQSGFGRNYEIAVRLEKDHFQYAKTLRDVLADRIEECTKLWTVESDTEFESRHLPKIAVENLVQDKEAIRARFVRQHKDMQMIDFFYELFHKSVSEEEPVNDAIKNLLDASPDDIELYRERICHIRPTVSVKELYDELQDALDQAVDGMAKCESDEE